LKLISLAGLMQFDTIYW